MQLIYLTVSREGIIVYRCVNSSLYLIYWNKIGLFIYLYLLILFVYVCLLGFIRFIHNLDFVYSKSLLPFHARFLVCSFTLSYFVHLFRIHLIAFIIIHFDFFLIICLSYIHFFYSSHNKFYLCFNVIRV